jgi:enterochelin esterase-like enzyme
MGRIFSTGGLLLCSLLGWGQVQSLQSILKPLYEYSHLTDSTERNTKVEAWWKSLQKTHGIPLVIEDSVAFLFKGSARTVEWTGDFNGWGYNHSFNNKGTRIPGTDVRIFKASFTKDTRLDYKVMLNGSQQILDPENPHQQWSGVGGGSPNSELRMPEWKEDALLQPRPGIEKGKVITDILFNSKVLGYQLMFNVYLPAGYEKFGKLPGLYVTDGYEYMHPKLGNMITILDNLNADKKIKPIIVIFIDHREPVNRSNNKRMEELAMNEVYYDFFTQEFIPHIESTYPVIVDPTQRAILGESMGGLTAAYFAFIKPGVFGMAGIQSPAFRARPQIYSICDNPQHPIKVSMTSGLISDAGEASRKMKSILENNACVYKYREVNDGHSWGNWRNLIDDILLDFFEN